MDRPEIEAAPRDTVPAVRSWPFVTIIAADMLLLLLLGYLAYRDLSERLDTVNKTTAVQYEYLKERVDQLEGAQVLDQMDSSHNSPSPRKAAPKR